jgi:hypothetical protein
MLFFLTTIQMERCKHEKLKVEGHEPTRYKKSLNLQL